MKKKIIINCYLVLKINQFKENSQILIRPSTAVTHRTRDISIKNILKKGFAFLNLRANVIRRLKNALSMYSPKRAYYDKAAIFHSVSIQNVEII